MERPNSNRLHSGRRQKNTISQMAELWKADTNWNNITRKDRQRCIWFALSFCCLLCLYHTWLVIPAVISLLASSASLKNINIKE